MTKPLHLLYYILVIKNYELRIIQIFSIVLFYNVVIIFHKYPCLIDLKMLYMN